jgi:hypothetical protein
MCKRMFKPLTESEVSFSIIVEQEDFSTPEEDLDPEVAAKVRADMAWSVWAWCQVTVVAEWGGFKGRDHLGCCSYGSEAEFKADGYYTDMKKTALADLNESIRQWTDKYGERLIAGNERNPEAMGYDCEFGD